MTDYSGTPLNKKLGMKDGFKVYLKNPPEYYFEIIEPIPENIKFYKRLVHQMNMIHLFTQSKRELSQMLPQLLGHIHSEGMIWISWPKKSSNVITDMTEEIIREVALPLGLVDIKVCAVNETWSGLKLVIRKENRIKHRNNNGNRSKH